MQRFSKLFYLDTFKPKQKTSPKHKTSKVADKIHARHISSKSICSSSAVMIASIFAMSSLVGCQTIKDFAGGNEYAITTASKSDSQYYQDALKAMDKGQYLYASEQLGELRAFYPTGQYSEQALLDLMYSQFKAKEYELAAASAEQFIKLYPRNSQVDYAYYVRGVANMQTAHDVILNFAKLKQAHRDTAYLRLAFNNFNELVSRYPNSAYTPDAAQRMSYIYNQLAESELEAARWYIERKANVAAVNRAKWVFNYYPLSKQTPEAIAILAYGYDQLGLIDLAKQYKTLLQINYPNWLDSNGRVKLKNNASSSLLSAVSFGKLGRSDKDNTPTGTQTYSGPTKTQIINRAAQLKLPDDTSTVAPIKSSLESLTNTQSRNINIGLGLPEDANSATTSPIDDDSSLSQTPRNTISVSELSKTNDQSNDQLNDSGVQNPVVNE